MLSSINHTPREPTFHESPFEILCFNFRPRTSTKSEYFKRRKLTSSKFQLPLPPLPSMWRKSKRPYHIYPPSESRALFRTFLTHHTLHVDDCSCECRIPCPGLLLSLLLLQNPTTGRRMIEGKNVIRISNWQANMFVCVGCLHCETGSTIKWGPYSPKRFTFNFPPRQPATDSTGAKPTHSTDRPSDRPATHTYTHRHLLENQFRGDCVKICKFISFYARLDFSSFFSQSDHPVEGKIGSCLPRCH